MSNWTNWTIGHMSKSNWTCPIGHLYIIILRNKDNLILKFFFPFLVFFFSVLCSIMPPPKHSYTKYIIVLNEKSNKYNYCGLCCYCKTKITNTKRLVISHLKSCKQFKKKYTKDEKDKILYPEKYEEKD